MFRNIIGAALVIQYPFFIFQIKALFYGYSSISLFVNYLCLELFPRRDTFVYEIKVSEAAVRRCSSEYVLLKILQYSQENTCVGVSFQ